MDLYIKLEPNEIDELLSLGTQLEDEGKKSLALYLFKICAFYGDVTAMIKAADLMSDPMDPIDFESAKKLYGQACLRGHWPACANLSALYRDLGDSARHQRYLQRARLLSGDAALDVAPADE